MIVTQMVDNTGNDLRYLGVIIQRSKKVKMRLSGG